MESMDMQPLALSLRVRSAPLTDESRDARRLTVLSPASQSSPSSSKWPFLPLVMHGKPQHPMYSCPRSVYSCALAFGPSSVLSGRSFPRLLYMIRLVLTGLRWSEVAALSGCSSIMAKGSNASSPWTGFIGPSRSRYLMGCPSGVTHSTAYAVTGTGNVTESRLAQFLRRSPFRHLKDRNRLLTTVIAPMIANCPTMCEFNG
mmetsp:Transcript_32632/g.93140  ORF Transcript_32632/g.93140 Transcript_32632/m.93140 type:complete len:202 (-) Transcript_32632:626-1231(-)